MIQDEAWRFLLRWSERYDGTRDTTDRAWAWADLEQATTGGPPDNAGAWRASLATAFDAGRVYEQELYRPTDAPDDLRAEVQRLRDWQAGATGAATIMYPPRVGPHTEAAFHAHAAAYEGGSEDYRAGADVVAAGHLAAKEAGEVAANPLAGMTADPLALAALAIHEIQEGRHPSPGMMEALVAVAKNGSTRRPDDLRAEVERLTRERDEARQLFGGVVLALRAAGFESVSLPLEKTIAKLIRERDDARALLAWPSRKEPPTVAEVEAGHVWWMTLGDYGRWYPLPSALVVQGGILGCRLPDGPFIPLTSSDAVSPYYGRAWRCHDGACRPALLPAGPDEVGR